VLPVLHAGIGGQTLLDLGELEPCLGELLGNGLAPDAGLLGGEPRGIHGLAGLRYALLRGDPPLIERA
jgi:hypothetical protein